MNSDDELIDAAAAVLSPRRVGERMFGDVGAALRTPDGQVFTGVCIDTGATGLGAEQVAVAAMVTAGQYAIDTIVAVWRDEIGALYVLPPCGHCREFFRQVDPANLDTRVVLGRGDVLALRELLPRHEWPGPLA